MEYGLVGAKLSHSYSPRIHGLFADYDYELVEVAEDEFDDFIKARNFKGLNVTIPYKKAVMKHCDIITEKAALVGSANTIVVGADGKLTGHNTDYEGFIYSVMTSGISIADKKILVLGSGGSSVMVQAALEGHGAREVVVISRSGENNYKNLYLHYDADVIVNTTPVGMYPNNGESPLNLKKFTKLGGVFDLIYNPAKTALLLQAEALHIPYCNGLKMLVTQAKFAAEHFTGKEINFGEIERITEILKSEMQNIILIGMPGSGKTTVGKLLAQKLNREFIDTDEYIEQKTGRKIPDIIEQDTESGFRSIEAGCVNEICKKSKAIIATGGGAVLKQANRDAIRQNAKVVFLNRDIAELPTDGRPLSKDISNLQHMYEVRRPIYKSLADIEIKCNIPAEQIAEQIIEKMQV